MKPIKVKARRKKLPKQQTAERPVEHRDKQDLVEKHSLEATAVTRTENAKKKSEEELEMETTKKMEKQSLMQRVKNMVFKW